MAESWEGGAAEGGGLLFLCFMVEGVGILEELLAMAPRWVKAITSWLL